MHNLPLALSIHKFVNSVGAEVGFASLIGTALLVILYFAHARETATLRTRLTAAHERIDALEARVAQLIQLQSVRPQQSAAASRQPTVTPPPSSVTARPMGSAVASVRRVPSAAAGAGLLPAAPAGMAAPALASATKLIRDPIAPVRVVTPPPLPVSQETMLVPGGIQANPENGNGLGAGSGVAAGVGAATVAASAFASPAAPAGAPATGAAGGDRGPDWGDEGSVPPRVQIRSEEPIGTIPRRTVPPSRAGAPAPRRQRSRGRVFVRRVLPTLIGLAVVAAVVVVLLGLTSSGTPAKSNVPHRHHGGGVTAGGFRPHEWIVAVLNGTSVNKLAQYVSTDLTHKGYRPGAVANAAIQTQQTSIVSYANAGSKTEKLAAQHVAKALGLKPSVVQPASQSTLTSCASTSASGNSCQAQVIVTLGTDLAGMASGSSSS